MYEVFYKLKAEPFRLSPDHKFCFEHKSYAKARAYMAYAFKRAEGFVMITGRPGTGKTTLIGELVESLSRDKVFTANLVCTQLQADDLLKTVAYNFGVGSAKIDKAELLQRLNILFHRWHREGRRALLIVDEAQDLSPSAMEELRLLTNIQIGGQPLLQIFLLGQPELRDLILSAEMEQVHQRIVAASHIEGLEVDETEAYVIHRLLVVGWQGDPALDRAIFPLIHKFSEGVPRRINLICSRLFLLGSVEERHAIEVEDVRVVIGELQAENLAAGSGYSQDDFEVGTETEWVPVPVSARQEHTEHRLHAVNCEPDTDAARELTEDADEAKKKDIPDVAPVSQLVPAGNSTRPLGSRDRIHVKSGGSDRGDPLTNNAEEISNSALVGQGDGEQTIDPIPHHPIGLRWKWRRAVVLGSAVIAAISLVLLLSFYFERQGERSYQNLELGEEQANVASGEQTVPAASGPDARFQLPNPPRGQVGFTSPNRASGISDDAPIIAKSSLEPISPHPAGGAAVGGALLRQSSEDAKQMDWNEVAAAEDSIEREGGVLPAEPETSEPPILISFSFDSDDLYPGSYNALDTAVERLRSHPASVATITGFTDDLGDEQYNLVLSRKRAAAVEQYLVDAGVERARLHVEGRGVLIAPIEERVLDVGVVASEPRRIVQIKLDTNLSQ